MATKEITRAGRDRCPECESQRTDYGDPWYDREHVTYPGVCMNCSCKWNECYKLVEVAIIIHGEEVEK